MTTDHDSNRCKDEACETCHDINVEGRDIVPGESRALAAQISGFTGEAIVTDAEVAEVVAWCRDWMSECGFAIEDEAEEGSYARSFNDGETLRYCHAKIEGGLSFVLADVRRCAVKPSDTATASERIRHARELAAIEDASEDADYAHVLSLIGIDKTEDDKTAARIVGASRLADDADVSERTRDGRQLTAMQRATVAKLAEGIENDYRSPVGVSLAAYGSSAVLAVVWHCDNPAPNPVRSLWLDGCSYAVASDDDYAQWLAKLEPSRATIQRADDEAFVIEQGGSYRALRA